MEISYKNSFWDHLQFNLYLILHSKIALIILLVPILFNVGWLAFDLLRSPRSSSAVAKVISLIILCIGGFGVLLLLLMFVVLIGAFATYFGRNAKWDEAKIQVTENNLITEASVGRSEIQWSGIKAIKQNKRFIFIFLSAYMACVVPKRAFATEADANRFFAYITELWEKHKVENASKKIQA